MWRSYRKFDHYWVRPAAPKVYPMGPAAAVDADPVLARHFSKASFKVSVENGIQKHFAFSDMTAGIISEQNNYGTRCIDEGGDFHQQ